MRKPERLELVNERYNLEKKLNKYKREVNFLEIKLEIINYRLKQLDQEKVFKFLKEEKRPKRQIAKKV